MERTPERLRGHLPVHPLLRWNRKQCQQKCSLWACAMGKSGYSSARSEASSPRGETLKGLSPSARGSEPAYLTPQNRSKGKRHIQGPLLNNNGACHGPDSNCRAKGRPCSVSTSPARRQTPEARRNTILWPAERRPQTQMRQQRHCMQTKEQDKKSTRPTKWTG